MMASPYRVIALLVATSLGVSSTAGFAQNRCQAGGPGCVLPLRAPPVAALPPSAPVTSAPLPVEAPAAVAAARSGISPFLLIALAAAAALAAYFLLRGEDDDEAPASP